MSCPHFRFYKRPDILNITNLRRFETKIGECLQTVNDTLQEALLNTKARFVLLGIPEDIGVLADDGTGGADTAWMSFLRAFCNLQSTDVFSGEEIMALGHFDFSDIKALISANAKSQEELIDACRHAVANIIDIEAEEIIKQVSAAGKIPVIIGGGHNNTYPLIKGMSKSLYKAGKLRNGKLNIINADAHAHYSVMEGRHSNNSLRYAKEEGFLNKYAIVGLQENANSQGMIDELYSNINIQYFTCEDIFVREKLNFRQALMQAVSFTEDAPAGIELDLDTIEQEGAGSGFTALHARQYVSFMAAYSAAVYLHICGSCSQTANGLGNNLQGKFIASLVSDFIKSYPRN